MSDFMQALVVGGSIAVVVVLTQVGRHQLDRRGILRALAMVGGVGYFYVRGAPTGHPELALYGVAVLVGLVFAAVATAATVVERDAVTGRVVTVCGAGFVLTWAVALGVRLAFVFAAGHDQAFRSQLGRLMTEHQVHPSAIPPFFVLWAVAMVCGRIVANLVRARQLPGAPVVPTALAAAAAA